MARWGRVDFSALKRMQKKMERLERAGFDKFCEDAAKELAARLLAKVIKRTPVGIYGDGRTGGTLRNTWTVDTVVKKVGNTYQIEVFNPTEYGIYVEFGHRTRDHKGWVNGRFMMTISADEVERAAPAILERKLTKLLKEAFDGD